ncbi:LysR family transcriptional regulator [Hydrogenophaga sp.]|uniref:LysR family transcriptional regulator n=1 Tax=Hydrogenophaga sp. TaxID=1904254 RepID=UPI00286E37A8|nr:LysR family transcriptional regulator [Hydrogenophaga sp.]
MSRPLDAYNLQLFTAVAREGSIARAAACEHIAPSALSRRLADLEAALGGALLVRSPRGIALTDAGRLVLARAERIDHELQQLAGDVQALGDEVAGTVRLWANPSAVIGALPERLQALHGRYPRVSVRLQEGNTADVLRACLDDRADVGVAVQTDAPPGIETWAFADDPLMVVLPAGHPLARQRTLSFAQVLDHPLVGVQVGGSLHQTLSQRAAALHRPISFAVTVNSFDAVCRMVEAGLGIAVVPASAASAYAGTRRFVRRALDEAWAERQLCVYALRKTPRLRAVQALIEALRAPA